MMGVKKMCDDRVRSKEIVQMVEAITPDSGVYPHFIWRVSRTWGFDVGTDAAGNYLSPQDAKAVAERIAKLSTAPLKYNGELWYDSNLAAEYLTETTGYDQNPSYIWKMLARMDDECERKKLHGRLRTPQRELDRFTEWYLSLPIGDRGRPQQPKTAKNVNITFTNNGKSNNAKRSREENEEIIANLVKKVKSGKVKPRYLPGPSMGDRVYSTMDSWLIPDQELRAWKPFD
jgi:hypothetical protein